jgi:uncharacterized protein YbaR (Trm112 family)
MEFVYVNSYNNYIEANIALSMLQDEGINCHLKDENINSLLSMHSGMRLMVFHSQTERAMEIMKNAEKKYLETIACPNCRNHSLEIKLVTKSMRPFPGKYFSFLRRLISKEGINTKFKHYSCRNCNKEYEELPAQIE